MYPVQRMNIYFQLVPVGISSTLRLVHMNGASRLKRYHFCIVFNDPQVLKECIRREHCEIMSLMTVCLLDQPQPINWSIVFS